MTSAVAASPIPVLKHLEDIPVQAGIDERIKNFAVRVMGQFINTFPAKITPEVLRCRQEMHNLQEEKMQRWSTMEFINSMISFLYANQSLKGDFFSMWEKEAAMENRAAPATW